jgi:hypothetical protein
MRPTPIWIGAGLVLAGVSGLAVIKIARLSASVDPVESQESASLMSTIAIPVPVTTGDAPVVAVDTFNTSPRVLLFIGAFSLGPGSTGQTQQCMTRDWLDARADKTVSLVTGNWKVSMAPRDGKKWADVSSHSDLLVTTVPFVPPAPKK